MNFIEHQNVNETEYFLTRKSLKLVDDISNQFNHKYYQTFLSITSEIRRSSRNFNPTLVLKYAIRASFSPV